MTTGLAGWLVGDLACAADFLRALAGANGKVGVIGYCSRGRQAFLAACNLPLDAAADKNPTPPEAAELSQALDKARKAHKFHTYDGAGHAFFAVDRVAYRPEAANDGWQKIWNFYGRYLAS